ncbi:uncharacterized protein LOC135698598 [Ochlerotatus camptorhynchus]|uniref:uncharacterized protein LOC135698598 n=1 Tax=Ochlerotatus camptorhynchus TaxID=644619 RepID=UPI0031CF8514
MLPTAALKETPYELWNDEKPDLRHRQIFGTPAFVYVPKEKRTKLQPKAVKILFVGYSSNHKGYRMIGPTTHKLVVSRDIPATIHGECVPEDEDSCTEMDDDFSEATSISLLTDVDDSIVGEEYNDLEEEVAVEGDGIKRSMRENKAGFR